MRSVIGTPVVETPVGDPFRKMHVNVTFLLEGGDMSYVVVLLNNNSVISAAAENNRFEGNSNYTTSCIFDRLD
jgi:hypothetical protein